MLGRELVAAVAVGLLCLPPAPLAQQSAPPPDDAAKEEFLRTARIVRTRAAGKGVTGSTRATMQLGELIHDAHIQIVDESKAEFKSAKGVEFNFRDRWQFNVAAYRIDRLLGLGIVPVTVERRWRFAPASFTWWVDDVLMDEGERVKQKVTAPNEDCWNEQRQLVRVFDQLIDNTDRNVGNLIITRTWRLWAIDHTRAFRKAKTPSKPETLTRIDRRILERLAALDFATLKRAAGSYIDDAEVRAVLTRRDAMVAHFKARGEAVLYDRAQTETGCQRSASVH